ncbi:hypothetical protein GCM10010441_68870 [Kitasatospora paracochleata]|uniref:MalT-like TPR region domain-containing protein n=1 Tax=Kitasatospora paracochleata TaxID=58354 RepID=A0ABT1IVI0_9ACTN|nr:hypothetical protein [Kitasatospora paracochleata]MCP2309144.1 hypothetical protein [Kitasatospora paracochleata]
MTVEERAADLLRQARSRLLSGDVAAARTLLERAGEEWLAAGDAAEQARCNALAATLARYQQRSAERADQPAPEQRQARLLVAAGRADEATEVLLRASAALAAGGAVAEGARLLAEGVVLLQATGQGDAAQRLSAEAEILAAAARNHAVSAELALLAAGRAIEERDLEAAVAHAERSRVESLAGRSVGGYTAAVIALAELADARGDLKGSYGVLATGWVTTADLVGADLARTAFEPLLLAMRRRWGGARFDAARAAYETERRAILRGEAP